MAGATQRTKVDLSIIILLVLGAVSFFVSFELISPQIQELTEERFPLINLLRWLICGSLILTSTLAPWIRPIAAMLNFILAGFLALMLSLNAAIIFEMNALSVYIWTISSLCSTIPLGLLLIHYRTNIIGGFKRFRIQLFAIAILGIFGFSFTELWLRIIGEKPGYIRHQYFKQVDSLVVYPDLTADEFGIQHFTNETTEKVARLATLPCLSRQDSTEWNKLSSAPWRLARDVRDSNTGKVETVFSEHLSVLQESKGLDAIDSAVMSISTNPLNSYGFRGIPFQNHQTDKTKVLLLGDSFTWGWSASNLNNSFSDHLTAKGYAIYNSGISATDPAQYQAVAKKFVGQIQPDVVVVNFYMANDLVYHHRTPKPNQIYSWETNAGVFYSFPKGKYIADVDSAFEFVVKANSVSERDHPFLHWLFTSTAITTRIWNVLARMGAGYYLMAKEYTIPPSETPCVDQHMKAIAEVCAQHNTRLIISIIPDHSNLADDTYQDLFGNLKPAFPNEVDISHYEVENGHFNDIGHEVYANFLALQIDSVLNHLPP